MTTTQQGQLSDCCDVACLQSSPSDQFIEKHSATEATALTSGPTISIGLPVFNGENFIAEAIESVLAQTFAGFELIISDNASTDRTRDICLQYVRRDRRIRYFRSDTNRGPAWNYNQVFHLSCGTYFKWAAHDDTFEPTFLAAMLDRLVQNPVAVLSFSQVDVINAYSERICRYEVNLDLDGRLASKRFQETISLKHRCYEIFGLIRRSRLAQTDLIGPYAGSDRVLLSQLILQGAFDVVPEPLFQAREHKQQSIEMLRKPRSKHFRMHDYAVWFDPLNKGKVLFPNWRILGEYVAAIGSAPISTLEKMRCSKVLCQWLLSYNNVGKLVRDVAIAIVQIIARLRHQLLPHQTGHRTSDRTANRTSDRTLENWQSSHSETTKKERVEVRSYRSD